MVTWSDNNAKLIPPCSTLVRGFRAFFVLFGAFSHIETHTHGPMDSRPPPLLLLHKDTHTHTPRAFGAFRAFRAFLSGPTPRAFSCFSCFFRAFWCFFATLLLITLTQHFAKSGVSLFHTYTLSRA